MKLKTILVIVLTVVLLLLGSLISAFLNPEEEAVEETTAATETVNTNAKNPEHEFLVGSAAWQMSAEAHALMMQSFNIAKENVDEALEKAVEGVEGYTLEETDGTKKLFKNGKRVAVVCDIDDTLVDGVHYTANIIGKDGEWTNKAFTEFIQSAGCTALPGAVDFTNYCIENGVALFYVTNRYDQGYKTSEEGYNGEEGYKKADGTVIGSSTYDIFDKTMYDITMASMAALGFPTNDAENTNFNEDAILIVNDTKLNGSSKQGIRDAIANGETLSTGERTAESDKYPETVDLNEHHIEMLLGDDLNDINGIFSDSEATAVTRVELTIENMDKWGSEWIVFPNAVYGSAINYASSYGYPELFDTFDYTVTDNATWEIYK